MQYPKIANTPFKEAMMASPMPKEIKAKLKDAKPLEIKNVKIIKKSKRRKK